MLADKAPLTCAPEQFNHFFFSFWVKIVSTKKLSLYFQLRIILCLKDGQSFVQIKKKRLEIQ